jgi:hypothetical protein
MTTTTDTCWADPLSRMERKELRLKLARAGKRFWDAADASSIRRGSLGNALLKASAEMADLHLDVTERAEVTA